jgi:hypothetical protein
MKMSQLDEGILLALFTLMTVRLLTAQTFESLCCRARFRGFSI